MITLQNPGELDLRLIRTMGVNVKENENSIGFFGTGLKYAIAVFLRENIEFSLFIGTNEYNFYTESVTIRGKEFKYCYLKSEYDSLELPYTTDLGKNWDLWQAYREIHSNCLDEMGNISIGKNKKHSFEKEGYTTFRFKNLDEKINVSDIFLSYRDRVDPMNLLYSDETIDIFEGTSNYLYYNGIRAKDLYTPSLFTYNIKKECSLTEDRQLSYDFEVKRTINNAVIKLADKNSVAVKNIITAKNSFESNLEMDYYTNEKPTEQFTNIIQELKEEKKEINYNVSTYVSNHKPPKEPTKLEEKQEFIDDLQHLCDKYNVDVIESNALGFLSFELHGGILNISDEENDDE